jgi:hypothetical protein
VSIESLAARSPALSTEMSRKDGARGGFEELIKDFSVFNVPLALCAEEARMVRFHSSLFACTVLPIAT